ncbi:MAG: M20/M25/M40 family metallo-hydrolase [Kiritimatiellales bacterium]
MKNSSSAYDRTVEFLSGLVQIPSVSGQEAEAMEWLAEQFSRFNVTVEKIPMSNALKSDPDYSSPVPDISYDGRYNLRVVCKGRNSHRALAFNAHVDVVPPSEGMDDPWSGKIEDGILYGRGACDTKGPLSTIFCLLTMLQEQNKTPECDLIFHLVVEEENGGNGSLAMVRHGEKADGCIVLEPTEGKILTSIRGAVWFNIEFTGVAGHSGQAGKTRSALLTACDAISALTDYHRNLLAASKGIPLFDDYENPMPITFGKLIAGNWPAAAPNRATLEGVLGLLPNKTKEEICAEMEAALLGTGLGPDDFKLTFTYQHDCSVTDPAGELPQLLLASCRQHGFDSKIDAMPASCDAWLYNNILKIPTVVFGPGSLSVAHSKNEHIQLKEIEQAAAAIFDMVVN